MAYTIAKIDSPTEKQQGIINELHEFINDKKKLVHVIHGYAGTGKTYLLKHFLKQYKGNCCITAPSHKAVRVLETMLGKKGKTVHSLCGLRMNVDLDTFDIANPQFDPSGNDYIKNYNLLISRQLCYFSSSFSKFTRAYSH